MLLSVLAFLCFAPASVSSKCSPRECSSKFGGACSPFDGKCYVMCGEEASNATQVAREACDAKIDRHECDSLILETTPGKQEDTRKFACGVALPKTTCDCESKIAEISKRRKKGRKRPSSNSRKPPGKTDKNKKQEDDKNDKNTKPKDDKADKNGKQKDDKADTNNKQKEDKGDTSKNQKEDKGDTNKKQKEENDQNNADAAKASKMERLNTGLDSLAHMTTIAGFSNSTFHGMTTKEWDNFYDVCVPADYKEGGSKHRHDVMADAKKKGWSKTMTKDCATEEKLKKNVREKEGGSGNKPNINPSSSGGGNNSPPEEPEESGTPALIPWILVTAGVFSTRL